MSRTDHDDSRCHLALRNRSAHLSGYQHIPAASRAAFVGPYSARLRLSLPPSAVHLTACVLPGFQRPGLSVNAQPFLSPLHRFAIFRLSSLYCNRKGLSIHFSFSRQFSCAPFPGKGHEKAASGPDAAKTPCKARAAVRPLTSSSFPPCRSPRVRRRTRTSGRPDALP